MQDKRFFAWFFFSIVVGLTGCASEPQVERYDFAVNLALQPITRYNNKVLQVDELQAQPEYDSTAIAYSPPAVQYYDGGEWADTPARMLTPILVRSMQATRVFRAVLPPSTPTPHDLSLDIEIIGLLHELAPQPSRVRLTVRAKLFDSPSGHVLGTQLLEAVADAPSADARGAAAAANTAIARLLRQLTDFVLEYALAA